MGRTKPRRDAGASLVEFAIVLPLLMVVLFGTIQFGIAYDRKQSINAAAREAARLGSLPTTTLADVQGRAESAFSNTLDGPLSIQVFVPATSSVPLASLGAAPCAGHAGEDFAVVVSGPNEVAIPMWGTRTVTLQSRAEFRCE